MAEPDDQRPARLLISGYFGFNNAGDEAILTAMVTSLRQHLPRVELAVISGNPALTGEQHGVRTVGRTDLPGIARQLRWADLLLSGGGSVLQDVTSSRSLLYYLGVVLLARCLGTPVMFYAQGVGPIEKPFNRWLTARVADGVALITVREEGSRRVLQELGVKRPPIQVTADQVFCLEPAPSPEARSILEREGASLDGRPLVGVALRGWRGEERYTRAVARAADALVEEYGAQVVFMPLQATADRPVARDTAALMQHEAVVLEGDYSAMEIMALTGMMHLVIGMRLHALVFAAVQGVPLVGLVYDPKVEDFLRLVDQPSAGRVDEVDEQSLLAAARQVLEHREETQRRLGELGGELVRMAHENSRLVAGLLGR